MNRWVCRAAAALLLGGCSVVMAEERGDAKASCRQETKRVVVWPHGSPKAPPMARIENREVTVCDAKVSKRKSVVTG